MKKFKIKKHVLTGISYMLPLVVGAGICMALGQLVGGSSVREMTSGIGYWLYKSGSLGMSLVVPVICAFISYSLVDRPGLAPGFIVGLICNEIKAGFIGGIVGAFVVGAIAGLIIKYVKVPKAMQGLMPVMIIPVLTTAAAGILMFSVLGMPIVWLTNALTSWVSSLQTSSKFLFGAVLGGMAGFDFGGPVNKTMSAFVNGLMVDGIFEPEAVKFIGSMVPPIGVAISCLLTPKKYTKAEKEAIKVAFPMGLFMITEGVIPIAARDLVRVVFASVLGGAVGGGLSMIWGVGAPVPHGGFLSLPLFTRPAMFCLALLIGSVVMALSLCLTKKVVTEEDEKFDAMGDADATDDMDDLIIENF